MNSNIQFMDVVGGPAMLGLPTCTIRDSPEPSTSSFAPTGNNATSFRLKHISNSTPLHHTTAHDNNDTALPLRSNSIASSTPSRHPPPHLPASSMHRGAVAAPPHANKQLQIVNDDRFQAISALDTLQSLLDVATLIVDLRARTQFADTAGRFRDCVNVNVPSTLLRRAAFGIERLGQTMQDSWERSAFLRPVQVGGGGLDRVIVLDADAQNLVKDGGIYSLLGKYHAAGFTGQLRWLKGGFNAVLDCVKEHPSLDRHLDLGPLTVASSAGTTSALSQQQSSTGSSSSSSLASGDAARSNSQSSTQSNPPLDHFNRLRKPSLAGSFAFSSGDETSLPSQTSSFNLTPDTTPGTSVNSFGSSHNGSGHLQADETIKVDDGQANTSLAAAADEMLFCRDLPMEAFATYGRRPSNITLQNSGAPTPSVNKLLASYSLSSPRADWKMTASNPFFDNIRQSAENLSMETSMRQSKPFHISPELSKPDIFVHLPTFLQHLVQMSPEERGRAIAMEFFYIEEAEQKRLKSLMAWHSQHSESNPVSSPFASSPSRMSSFSTTYSLPESGDGAEGVDTSLNYLKTNPLSIAAGVEKGHLNRYKNIYPYEHARVRMERPAGSSQCDYANASHIRLRGSSKSFIACQGPLESGIEDFWNMIVQERVGVIVMLTRTHEEGREKCAEYFRNGRWGQFEVNVIDDESNPVTVNGQSNEGGGYFGTTETADKAGLGSLFRRTIVLINHDDPKDVNGQFLRPPRRIRHFQYVAWPDFGIPPDPKDVFAFHCEVERTESELRLMDDRLAGATVVHCSAGVGRTGGWILVDVMLETLRRQRASHQTPFLGMEVDESPTPSLNKTSAVTAFMDNPLDQTLANITLANIGTSLLSQRRHTPPSERQDHPMVHTADEMREQRMNMIANAGQYEFIYSVIIEGVVQDIRQERLQAKKASRAT